MRRTFATLTALLLTAGAAVAIPNSIACAGDTFVNGEQAGPVFELQGEYMGVLDDWDGTWGAQVIATGTQSLEVHLLKGGLPGDGFKDREPTKQCKATVDGGSATGKSDEFRVELNGKTMLVFDSSGKKIGTITKMKRESKTLGMEAPRDATILFDGSGVDNFRDGKFIDASYLGVGCTSKEAFTDHKLHIEFRTPFQPQDSGQARGNSGVYVQGRYELQVLDSFGLRGEDNECGGIYQIAKPKLNMCYPPLSWQTYDIEFIAPKYDESGKKTNNAFVTIRHNGILIHEDLELPRGTPGGTGPESGEPGPLFLQDHGNPVYYRNIWVTSLKTNDDSPRKGLRAGKGAAVE